MIKKLLEKLGSFEINERVAVACSGGVDSLFLSYCLSLLKIDFIAIIVNHNLQDGSDFIAKETATKLEKWGISSVTLEWKHEKITTAVEERARKARYELICNYCKENGIRKVFLGHHIDDKIETFLMQASRGTGIGGISSMKERVFVGGVEFFRPMLYLCEKLQIIEEAQMHGIEWFEDKTNADFTYTRNWFRGNVVLSSQQKQGILTTVRNVESSFKMLRFYVNKKIIQSGFGVFLCEMPEKQEVWLFLQEVVQRIFPFGFFEIRQEKVRNFENWLFSEEKKTTLSSIVFEKSEGKIIAIPEFKRLKGLQIEKDAIWNKICKISVNLPCVVVPLGLVSFSVKKKFKIRENFNKIAHFPVFMEGKNILAIPHLKIHCAENFKVQIHEN